MKTNCAFTIVAKNYVGLAQLLQKSIMHHNSNIDFYIIVADELDTLRLLLDVSRSQTGDARP